MTGSLDDAPRWQRKQALWGARAQLAAMRKRTWESRRVQTFLAFRTADRVLDGMIARQGRRRG